MNRHFLLDTIRQANVESIKPLGFWPDKTRLETCEYCEDEFHPSAENQRTDRAGNFSHWQCDCCLEKQQMYGSEW